MFLISALALLLGAGAFAFALRSWRRIQLLRSHFDMHVRTTEDLNRLVDHCLRTSALLPPVSERAPVEKLSFSQHGEDVIAWNLLGRPRSGFFFEAGAHDGKTLSNTFLLEAMGWTGLLVEAHPDLAEHCKRSRPKSHVVHAALGIDGGPEFCEFQMVRGAEGVDALSFSVAADSHRQRILREGGKLETVSVPCQSLNQLLAEMNAPQIDFFSLDVEGAEMMVLQGFDFDRWQPKVLSVEDNSNGSDTAVSNYILARGYRRILRVACNDFYIRT